MGLRPLPLSKDARDRINKVLRARKSRKQLDAFFDEVEIGIARYRAAAEANKQLGKKVVLKKFETLYHQTMKLLNMVANRVDDQNNVVVNLNDHTADLIRTIGQPFYAATGHPSQRPYPTASIAQLVGALCGFSNVVSDAMAVARSWPSGVQTDWGRRLLAYHVAKGSRDGLGIRPTNSRSGTYHRLLDAVLLEVGIKGKGYGRDLAPLARVALRILNSESPSGEISVVA